MKICAVTGARAEYGLLYNLIRQIDDDPDLELQLVATCMHLSPEFGLTYQEIEGDGFKIIRKVEMLLSSDSPVGVTKSMGLGLISFSEAFEQLKPDILLLLGDRFETITAAIAGILGRIPIAHLYGGELTAGVIDDAFRHAVTKMSHLHFTSTEEYRRRVIQLGESPDTVFNVGALGVENIKRLKLLSKYELERDIGFKIGERCILVTFHPVTLDNTPAKEQFQNLLDTIDEFKGMRIIFTKANADPAGRTINMLIDEFVNNNSHKSISFTSMGQVRYLSAMKHVQAVVGNSSSGIIEAPSLGVTTVNIGDRQMGRVQSRSVINCRPVKSEITKAITKVLSNEFRQAIKDSPNPYEKEKTSSVIMKTIKMFNWKNALMKRFHDLPV